MALSTCEVEYMSLVAAIQEGKYLTSFLNEVISLNQKMFTLHCDNQRAIALAKNPVQHQRTKHIDVKYHFVRDKISDGKLKLLYVPSENNLADFFTKPVAKSKNCKFKSKVMGKISFVLHFSFTFQFKCIAYNKHILWCILSHMAQT